MPEATFPAPSAESPDSATPDDDAQSAIARAAATPIRTDHAVPADPACAVEEVAGGDLRARWLGAEPTPAVTYVAALPPAGRRGRSPSRMPGNARSSTPPPRPPAAPALRRSVKQTVALLWACVRRGGGRRMSLLAASAMLLVLLGGAFTLGARYGGGPRAVDAAPAPATAALPAAAPVVAAPAATSPPRASAGSAAVPFTPPTAATAAPARVAVRLSCADDANTLGLGVDLRTAEVIAAGVNRCAGWQLVQADTVVTWVPSTALPAVSSAPVTTAEATR